MSRLMTSYPDFLLTGLWVAHDTVWQQGAELWRNEQEGCFSGLLGPAVISRFVERAFYLMEADGDEPFPYTQAYVMDVFVKIRKLPESRKQSERARLDVDWTVKVKDPELRRKQERILDDSEIVRLRWFLRYGELMSESWKLDPPEGHSRTTPYMREILIELGSRDYMAAWGDLKRRIYRLQKDAAQEETAEQDAVAITV